MPLSRGGASDAGRPRPALTHAARGLPVVRIFDVDRPPRLGARINLSRICAQNQRAPRFTVTHSIIMRVSLARQQPMGINPRDVDQFQNDMSRHCDPRLVIEPGLNPDLQGIGEELGAVFPAQIFANLSEAFGQLAAASDDSSRT